VLGGAMLLVRHGTDPRQRKGDPVNAVSIIYVNDHLEDLWAQTRQHRLAASLASKPSRRARLAATLATIRRTIAADEIAQNVPNLSHWPYRV
jgi:hypothetical protein